MLTSFWTSLVNVLLFSDGKFINHYKNASLENQLFFSEYGCTMMMLVTIVIVMIKTIVIIGEPADA